jgi:TolA-binding protein
MESDVTQSAVFFRLWAWGDAHRKEVLWGFVALVAVALGIVLWFLHQNNAQIEANSALSKIIMPAIPTTTTPPPESFITVAADYPDTDAGQRAMLLGASAFYTAGRFEEAQAQYQRFLQQHGDSPFAAQAALGAAVCYEALGRTNDALTAYHNVAGHYQTLSVAPQARFAVVRLLEVQGKYQDALNELKEIISLFPNFVGAQANQEAEALLAAHPELAAAIAPPPSAMPPPALTTH